MIRYYWIAEFNNGTSMAQFGDDGTEIMFSEVDKKRKDVTRIGWYPINNDMIKPIRKKYSGVFAMAKKDKCFVIDISQGEKFEIWRRNTIKYNNKRTIKYLIGKSGLYTIIDSDGNSHQTTNFGEI